MYSIDVFDLTSSKILTALKILLYLIWCIKNESVISSKYLEVHGAFWSERDLQFTQCCCCCCYRTLVVREKSDFIETQAFGVTLKSCKGTRRCRGVGQPANNHAVDGLSEARLSTFNKIFRRTNLLFPWTIRRWYGCVWSYGQTPQNISLDAQNSRSRHCKCGVREACGVRPTSVFKMTSLIVYAVAIIPCSNYVAVLLITSYCIILHFNLKSVRTRHRNRRNLYIRFAVS